MTTSSWVLPLCLFSCGLLGCGGTVNEVGADGAGGASSGGRHNGSGSATANGGEGSGTGGQALGTGGEGLDCCLAAAVCDEGDTQIDSKDDCPPGASCYSNSICCSTVWCVDESPVNCAALPSCQANEVEVSLCPEGATCHVRTMCGSSVLCQVEACDYDATFRYYVATSPTQCALADFACPAHTNGFSDACGCGCEQPSTCPEYVDCMPGGAAPQCATGECPYTPRVY